MRVYVTGDGICPWCGKIVKADDPNTHHAHNVSPSTIPFVKTLL